jgi:hypothetical protein
MIKRFSSALVWAVLASAAMLISPVSAQSPPLKLTISADTGHAYFRVDGVPRFLTFISYVDALRRMNASGGVTEDFERINLRGFDGIRIFPNWWHYACGGNTAADDDALFTSSGNGGVIRQTKLQLLKDVLDAAKTYNLLVNVSFTADTITGMDYTT